MGLLFFISVWMFVLGILVGRGTAPVRFDIQNIEKELTALKAALIKKEQQSYYTDTQDPEAKTTLGFYEALQGESVPGPEGEFKTDKLSESSVRTQGDQKALSAAPADDQVRTAEKASGQATQQALNPENTPLETGRYSVQVASSKDGAAATRMVAKLKKRGYAAYRARAVISGQGTWYRVRVGPFSGRDDAHRVRASLQKAGYEPIVVKQ